MVEKLIGRKEDVAFVNPLGKDKANDFDREKDGVVKCSGVESKMDDLSNGELNKCVGDIQGLDDSSTNIECKRKTYVGNGEDKCLGGNFENFDDTVFRISSQFGETLLQREMSMKKPRVCTINQKCSKLSNVKVGSQSVSSSIGGPVDRRKKTVNV
ncbi:uncharacterized protein LOC133805213 [Humulus lupulus]|uniref:uncharacterized protein LOC133805213 n=1 Tax=Humulus lupulus TaxID=3486 RepID=UPI002B410493|nr:uncharacterized protein LOC133805213 [Humulus lupulus]